MEQSGSEEVSIPSSLDENEANDGSSAPAVEDFEEKRQEYEKIEAKWGHDLQLDPSDSNLRSVRTAAVIPFPLFLFFSFFFFLVSIHPSGCVVQPQPVVIRRCLSSGLCNPPFTPPLDFIFSKKKN